MSTIELIKACADSNDGAAWQEFVARFHRPVCLSILRIASRWGASPQQVVDDLAQETYLKLCADGCRLLRSFAEDHPDQVENYIRTIAINAAHDHFKSVYSKRRGSGKVAQLSEDADRMVESGSFGGHTIMEREVLLKEIDDCLQTYSTGPDQERDWLIFWLYYRQGISAREIADLPTVQLTAKGVESAIFRLTRLVRERVANLRNRASLGEGEGKKGSHASQSY
jgi:RNA polymerase sigma-70 factor (ECF subfamily)